MAEKTQDSKGPGTADSGRQDSMQEPEQKADAGASVAVADKPVEIPKLLDAELPPDEVKAPEQPILTVRLKKFMFFAAKGVPVFVLQNDQVVDHALTDRHGEVPFKLQPGEYVIRAGEQKIPINIKDHATLKLRM